MSIRTVIFLFALLGSTLGCMPDPQEASAPDLASNPYVATQQLLAQAQTVSEAGDFAAGIDLLEQAVALRPHHPPIRYRLARLQALDDRPDDALASLQRIIDMGIVADLEADPTLNALRELPAYTALLTRIAVLAQPVGDATSALTWHAPTYIPESVAYDPVADRYYVGSVHQQRIVQLAASGDVQPFSAPEDSLWSVFGLEVDTERRLLWATMAAIPHGKETTFEAIGQSGLVAYDLDTGTLTGRYLVHDTLDHWIGDLALADDGTVFATDSETNQIHVLEPGADTLQLFTESPEFVSLQGIALAPDQTHFYVADYARGIFRVDRVTRQVTLLPYPENATLLGVDGLYVYQNGLVAIQNGIRPHRVVYAAFTDDRTRITSVDVLAANLPDFDEPTLGVIVDSAFYFVANSQWGHFDADARLIPTNLADPVILRLPLD